MSTVPIPIQQTGKRLHSLPIQATPTVGAL